ncbi:MAG TPA: winged helix-turn-helix domain-containing protein [Steroidobacteraceae bacterium]|nr:winged helix-turn-helix domain-containing protein [Steroidobacteraceae bacterium]
MASTSAPRPDFRLGEWLVRPSLSTIERGDEVAHVTPKSMAVLVYLSEARGAVVSRNALLDAVWPAMSVTPDALSQCVVELRKAFHDDPRNPAIIQTIPKVGLRLLAPAAPAPQPAAAVSRPPDRPSRRAALLSGAAVVLLIGAALLWIARQPGTWQDPLIGADYKPLTDFIGSEELATITPDGQFVAFVSDRDGQWDVYVGQTATGDFENLTRARIPELRNPSVRMLNFTRSASEVTIWSSHNRSWSVPVLGGELGPGPEGIAEIQWSDDGKRVVFHPAAPGDPLFVANADDVAHGRQIYAAPPGVHCHYPVWSRDGKTIYFVRGFVPDEMDLWEVAASGGTARRLTWHNSRVSFPTLLDDRTLLYLATSADGNGPWVYAFDLVDRHSHRVKSATNAYTSLAATADGRRLVVSAPHPSAGLWRVQLGAGVAGAQAVTSIPIHTQRGVSPRLGIDSLLYRAPKAGTDAVWSLDAASNARELWNGRGGRVIDGPVPSVDGQRIAFTVQSSGRTWLYVMSTEDRRAHRLVPELDVRGAPAWSPDGRWIAVAALQEGKPRLFKIPFAGGPAVVLTAEYALDPVWSPDGSFLAYTTADVGTVFEVHAVGADGANRALPKIVLSRGSRRLDFLGADARTLVVLKGALSRKEFWAVDLRTGAERALTDLGPGPVIEDFDVAPDGGSIVFDRARQESDLVLIDLPSKRSRS